jgi:protein-glutamine gamma-glutamyltransferase
VSRPAARPAALLPAPAARLAGFVCLAALGALEWQRMAGEGEAARGLLWVLVAGAGGLAVHVASQRLRGHLRSAAVVGVTGATLYAAFGAAGMDLGLLRPARWTELGDGVARGIEALGTVRLPYTGVDPWPFRVLEMGGALLCAVAGLLAMWPRERAPRGFPFLSLALLLVLVATPVVSLGGAQPVILGVALAALTIGFLWLERLPMRPGIGVAVMFGLAVAGALPVATMADRSDPWFDYRAFAEGLGSDRPVNFDWGHDYGGITWSRDGAEIMRVRAVRPSYWKLSTLTEFDGVRWRDPGFAPDLDNDPERDLPDGWEARREWTMDAQFSLRRLRTEVLPGAGTTLNVFDASRPVQRGDAPGVWEAETTLRPGDSYTARVHIPRPSPEELTEATSAGGGILAPERTLRLLLDPDAPPPLGTPTLPDGTPLSPGAADITFPPFGSPERPKANYRRIAVVADAGPALTHSPYTRAWRLARSLRRETRTPYEYALRVLDHLNTGFVYEERPPRAPEGTMPLDWFLFETRRGYCQHYSAAMALLLRMGGVPARVATGFSPGGYSKKREAWIVRDTDAHSWVEVWFDAYGWAAFDHTPPATPARSQIAAIVEDAGEDDESGDSGAGPAGGPGADAEGNPAREPGTRGDFFSNPAPDGGGADEDAAASDGSAWIWRGLLAALIVVAGLAARRLHRRRREGPADALERSIYELEQAFRRSGRPAPVGTTLRQLERRLGDGDAADYIRALRSSRYGPAPARPSGAQRRALRRELAAGAGWSGRLRALWALPPKPF